MRQHMFGWKGVETLSSFPDLLGTWLGVVIEAVWSSREITYL